MKTIAAAEIRKQMTKATKSKPKIEVQKMRENFSLLVAHLQEHDSHGMIVLPMPPNLANSRMFWAVKESLRQHYFSQCRMLQHADLIHLPPDEPPPMVFITATFYLKRQMDMDNLMARCKWSLDFLVRNDYLADDSPKHLTWLEMPQQVVGKSAPRIEFILGEK